MKELIKVIAFDADDTLWSNEPFFQEIEKQYVDMLTPYGTSEDISAALFQTEMNINRSSKGIAKVFWKNLYSNKRFSTKSSG